MPAECIVPDIDYRVSSKGRGDGDVFFCSVVTCDGGDIVLDCVEIPALPLVCQDLVWEDYKACTK